MDVCTATLTARNVYADERTKSTVLAISSINTEKNTKRRTSSHFYNKPGRNRGDTVSTAKPKECNPEVKRQYQDEPVALKRTTASDLTVNGKLDGSLWGSADPNAFLICH